MNTIRQVLPAAFAMTALAITSLGAQRTDTIVRMAPRPVHAGVATLVPEIRIGSVDGADEYVFGDIAEIAVARDGSVYVFDRQVPALRQYDANGKYVRTLGAKGSGPGEYRSGGGLAIHPDGRILLWDTGNWRVNVYSSAGASLTSWLTPSGATGNATMMTARSLVIDTAGAVYFRKPNFMMRRTGNSADQWVRLRADGAVLDTIPVPQSPSPQAEISARTATVGQSANVPFAPRFLTALSPMGYFVTALPAAYAFEILDSGRAVSSIRRPLTLTPVSDAERDSARKAIEANMRNVDPVWTWNGPPIPRTKAAFTSIAIGADGRIWIPLVPEVSPRAGAVQGGGGGAARIGGGPPPGAAPRPAPKPRPALYDVFEPTGTYLGQVEVPARVSSVFRRGDYVWGVEYDEDDVPYVRRFRIAWK
jgi:hypothetical protein